MHRLNGGKKSRNGHQHHSRIYYSEWRKLVWGTRDWELRIAFSMTKHAIWWFNKLDLELDFEFLFRFKYFSIESKLNDEERWEDQHYMTKCIYNDEMTMVLLIYLWKSRKMIFIPFQLHRKTRITTYFVTLKITLWS